MLLELTLAGRRHLERKVPRLKSGPRASLGTAIGWKGSLEDQSAMSSAGGSQRKRKAAVRE